MFSYIFEPPAQKGGGLPQLALFRIGGPFTLGGVEIVPVPLLHGMLPVLGFRIGTFAYLTDCNAIPDASWTLLMAAGGVRTVILDALRMRPHSTHFSVDEAIDVVSKLGAERAYFTHICHDLAHAETNARLPAGVELAYDGLVVEIP
jgi:phosphoribosyl 1,2-cyclic phosphate phosphodiesterase